MNSSNPGEQTSFQLTPAAKHAFTVYQMEIDKVYREILKHAEQRGLNCSEQQMQMFGQRLDLAFFYFRRKLCDIFDWLFRSKENTNFTYDITERNKMYLASMLGFISRVNPHTIRSYIDELNNDLALKEHIRKKTLSSPEMTTADAHAMYGRRLGWYATVRALKPKVVVETGVDKGMGSCVLSLALLKNGAEGSPGKYYGTDINPQAGFLYTEPYSTVGKILYGDSIESLSKLNEQIDVFINDSDHSAEYEAREYALIERKLAPKAVLLGDNAHTTSKLCEFAQATGRHFAFFPEEPEGHWYPGAGIGFAFSEF